MKIAERPDEQKSLKRDSLKLSAINGARIFFGFSFHILLGREFGISGELDSLFVALTIFTFAGMAHLFLTSLFIPTFNEIAHTDEEDAFVFADVVLKWSTGLVCIIVFFSLISPDLIVKVVASGFDIDRIALTREITQLILISLIFHTISITVTYLLNALYYFSFPAVTGLLHPVFNIASLYTLVPHYGIKAIAMAYLLSNALQACMLLSYLRINTGWRLTSRIYHNHLPPLFRNSSKMAVTGFVWDLREIISRNIASHLPSGSVAILAYAEKIVAILFQLAIGPISRVFYSRVSDFITANMWNKVTELLRKVVRINLVCVIFLSSGIILFLRPMLNAVFIHSRFTPDDIRMLYYLVLILLISLIVQSYKEHFVRIAYASKSIKTVAISAIFGLVTFTLTSLLFSYKYQVYGLAIAISITQLFISIVFYKFVSQLLSFKIDKIILKINRPLIIAILCTILGLFIQNLVQNNTFAISLIIPIWCLFYLFMLKRFIVSAEADFLAFETSLESR